MTEQIQDEEEMLAEAIRLSQMEETQRVEEQKTKHNISQVQNDFDTKMQLEEAALAKEELEMNEKIASMQKSSKATQEKEKKELI